MKLQEVNIATARIEGLSKPPYLFKPHYWAWDIMFFDTSTIMFEQLPFINVGYTEEKGVIFCNQIKANFDQANIYDGDKVAILYMKNGAVRAIGKIGHDSWIDVADNFVNKTFKELDISISSLKVH